LRGWLGVRETEGGVAGLDPVDFSGFRFLMAFRSCIRSLLAEATAAALMLLGKRPEARPRAEALVLPALLDGVRVILAFLPAMTLWTFAVEGDGTLDRVNPGIDLGLRIEAAEEPVEAEEAFLYTFSIANAEALFPDCPKGANLLGAFVEASDEAGEAALFVLVTVTLVGSF